MESGDWVAALCAGAAAFTGGWLFPRWVARIPEPDDPPEDKPRYADLAARPGLSWRLAAVSAAAALLVGLAIGAEASLPAWTYLVVVGAGLSFVDWRTRLLPTRVIAPSYAVMVLLLGLAAVTSGDDDAALRSLIGWGAAFVVYFLLWFVYPKGLGYGDVRLSGLIGMALGWISYSALVTGVYAGFVLGALVGGLLAVVKVVDRKAYPFGPFMIAGAWIGAVSSPWTAGWLG